MPLTITFPVFFTFSYVMVLMVKDAEKSLQLLQLFISKKTEKRIIINTSFLNALHKKRRHWNLYSSHIISAFNMLTIPFHNPMPGHRKEHFWI